MHKHFDPTINFLNLLGKKKQSLDDFYYQLSIDGFMSTIFNNDKNKINGVGQNVINSKNVLSEFLPEEIFTQDNYNFLGIKTVDFNYNLNQYGFRSEEFSTFNSKNINILTIGCSNSVGIGIPNEYTWSELLKEKIFLNNDKEVHIYNLSVSGGNIRLLIKNIITFINTVGRPNYIFALFPDVPRYIHFDKNKVEYSNGVWFKPDHNGQAKKSKIIASFQYSKKYQENYDHSINFFETTIYLHLLELMCNLSNINLKWGSWNHLDNALYNNIKFKNYIEFKNMDDFCVPLNYYHTFNKMMKITIMEKKRQIDKKNINDKPFWAIGSDLAHPGTYWHEQVANIFFESIKDLK